MQTNQYFQNFENIATLIVKASRFPQFRDIKWRADTIALTVGYQNIAAIAYQIDKSIGQKFHELSTESAQNAPLRRSDFSEAMWLKEVIRDGAKFETSEGIVLNASQLFAIWSLKILDDAAMFIHLMSDPNDVDLEDDSHCIQDKLDTNEQDLRCALIVSELLSSAMQTICQAESLLSESELNALLDKYHRRGFDAAVREEAYRRADEHEKIVERCKAGAAAKWKRHPLTALRAEATELCVELLEKWRANPSLYRGDSAFAEDMFNKIPTDSDGEPVYAFDTLLKRLLPKWKRQLS
ncbi:hypothetical protein [Duganella callida]|uniref:Uncharacterized protein n=1 Tax=Duganella callida TaxID=2561932 RepID=A0A4Y9SDI6_9BURK|nr:hypothetical protein [Duganella callida]TFW18863.1 hypothetical protein E4L98_17195 [Duganella callida]